MKKQPSFALVIIILSVSLVPLMLWGLVTGSVSMTLPAIRDAFYFFSGRGGDETAWTLIFLIRLPRIVLSLLVGASLGITGACFQGLFRNALADPYIIGASSGAALGAALAVSLGGLYGFGFFSALGPAGAAAFAGSLAAVILAFIISRASGNTPTPGTLIIAGTSVSALCSALLALTLVIKDRNLVQVYYWLLGSLAGTTWSRLLSALPFMIFGSIIIFLSSRPLDLLLQGEDAASSLGINPLKTRFILSIAATLPVAASVSVSGVIGFVGLIAPHGARFFTGPGHKKLLPAAALLGAFITITADNLARSLISPVELPLGIITSLGGAPFFLFLLARKRKDLGTL